MDSSGPNSEDGRNLRNVNDLSPNSDDSDDLSGSCRLSFSNLSLSSISIDEPSDSSSPTALVRFSVYSLPLELSHTATPSITNKAFPTPNITTPLRRCHSLDALLPHGNQNHYYRRIPPPTTLARTLSVSRTDLARRRSFTSEQKWSLLTLSLVSFASFLSMSVMAPFYPSVAKSKGMSEVETGFIFSFYALVIMIASPLIGKVVPMVGAKLVLTLGILSTGVSNILFGFLGDMEELEPFLMYSFLLRFTESLGAAGFSTASYTYIMHLFKDDIGAAFGLTETCVGLGMSLGPAIGSGLYTIGGFQLPFFTLGFCLLINIPLCFFFLQPLPVSQRQTEDEVEGSRVSYTSLIRIPKIWIISIVVVIVSQCLGFLEPTVETHFQKFGVESTFVGLVFLIFSGSYAICSPLIGCLSSRLENKMSLMTFGLILSGLGFLLLGPTELLPIPKSLAVSTIAMLVIGIAYSIAFIPTFECILQTAINNGLSDDIHTYAIVSGLWSSMYSLGEVSGPLLGGLFTQKFDFSKASTIMALFSFIAAVIASMGSLCTSFNRLMDRKSKFVSSSEKKESNDSSGADSGISDSLGERTKLLPKNIAHMKYAP